MQQTLTPYIVDENAWLGVGMFHFSLKEEEQQPSFFD